MSVNENELERLEAELRRVRPAPLPGGFAQRLKSMAPSRVVDSRAQTVLAAQSARPGRTVTSEPGRASAPAVGSPWLATVCRWLAPALAVGVILGVFVWRAHTPVGRGSLISAAPMKADHVQIDQQLVSTFDTVAALPSGEPVRFRCRQWMDEVVLQDSRRGLEVARRVPRVEVVPVRFETY